MNRIRKIIFEHVLPADVRFIIERWPGVSRKLAQSLTRKYGMPHAATQTMLIWYFNGPWKRTILHKEGAAHHVPHPHIDLLEQTVDFKVPADKIQQIAVFDGSIIIDRTRGEMTAYCEHERMNTWILNLAYEIAIGKKTVQEAHEELVKFEGPIRAMWPNPYKEMLQFTSTTELNDPD